MHASEVPAAAVTNFRAAQELKEAADVNYGVHIRLSKYTCCSSGEAGCSPVLGTEPFVEYGV